MQHSGAWSINRIRNDLWYKAQGVGTFATYTSRADRACVGIGVNLSALLRLRGHCWKPGPRPHQTQKAQLSVTNRP